MQFTTDDERASYFEMDCRHVEHGAAMEHAESTNLGIWGDTGRLMLDCAKIMQMELRKLAVDRGVIAEQQIQGLLFGDGAQRIMESRIFQQAFERARQPNTAHIHNAVRGLGSNVSHMTPMNDALSPDAEMEVADLTEALWDCLVTPTLNRQDLDNENWQARQRENHPR